MFTEVITICDETQSLRLGAEVRISLARLLLQWNDASKVKDDIASLIDPVLTNAVTSKFTELYEQAKDLKQQAATGTFKDVIQAMNMVDGYNYGGSWSSHWYECPNGHPYFIGNCGGATSTARCIECGESVGGSSHQLIASNRQFSGSFRALLDLEPLLLSETSHPLFSQSGTTIIYLFSDLLQRLLQHSFQYPSMLQWWLARLTWFSSCLVTILTTRGERIVRFLSYRTVISNHIFLITSSPNQTWYKKKVGTDDWRRRTNESITLQKNASFFSSFSLRTCLASATHFDYTTAGPIIPTTNFKL